MALSTLGLKVLLAGTGAECIEAARANRDEVALIVLDMRLPDMNGDEVTKALRAGGCTAPVLICSGFDVSPRGLEQMGATAYLGKPYRMRELAETCKTLIAGDGR